MTRSKTRTSSSRSSSKVKAGAVARSYTPLSDALAQPLTFADTELAEGIQRHNVISLLRAALQRSRRSDAEPLPNILCALLVWPLLQVKSIHCFCSELCQFLKGQVSVLYDFLGREDINWRGLSSQLAYRIYQGVQPGPPCQCAFVVDDTSQARAGRKVQGTSCYFDHTEGRSRRGHQVLQLGLAAEKGFLPIEAQLVMGEKSAVTKPPNKPFKDQRCSAARDLRRAQEHSKHQLFRAMLQRARQLGFQAYYLLGDAWFGCKENIACCLELALIGIFQMKRGKLTYEYQGRDYTAKELYLKVRRRMRPKNKQARYKTASLKVRLNLATAPRQDDHWVEVRLVFSAPTRSSQADCWVIFLCTDLTLSDEKILQVYSLRWSIEVYFKELKQHLGLFKEQSGRYELAYASVHLSAIRYLLLFEAVLRNGQLAYGQIRDRQSGQLLTLTYAALLWQLFRALIEGALEGLVRELGRKLVRRVLTTINRSVEDFLHHALQISTEQVAIQLKAEKLGEL